MASASSARRYPGPTYLDVPVPPVGEPLVHLVAEAQRVVLDAQVCDHLQLVSGEDLDQDNGFNFPINFISIAILITVPVSKGASQAHIVETPKKTTTLTLGAVRGN